MIHVFGGYFGDTCCHAQRAGSTVTGMEEKSDSKILADLSDGKDIHSPHPTQNLGQEAKSDLRPFCTNVLFGCLNPIHTFYVLFYIRIISVHLNTS